MLFTKVSRLQVQGIKKCYFTGNILMVVYSSISVPGTEFVTLGDAPLPSCLNTTELHVVGDLDLMMRPAVVTNEGADMVI